MTKPTLIQNVQRPEWGTWRVRESESRRVGESDIEGMYEIVGGRGARMLDKTEIPQYWTILK